LPGLAGENESPICRRKSRACRWDEKEPSDVAPQTISRQDNLGLKRTSDHVGFLGHDDELEFKNVRVKELRKP
jgi:hypothetical protein